MSGHQPKPCGQPLGAPPTGGSGASNPERDLSIRIEALRATVGLFGPGSRSTAAFAETLRWIESYLRTGAIT